jgi:hypothetical protein
MLKKNEKIDTINNKINIVNHYVESLNTLEIKYKLLQQENNDLLQNLEINKQIIKNFFKNTPFQKNLKKYYQRFKKKINYYMSK